MLVHTTVSRLSVPGIRTRVQMSTTLVLADDADAGETVINLTAGLAGIRLLVAGPLSNVASSRA
jgi:predicted dinucleotide-binding enzyme